MNPEFWATAQHEAAKMFGRRFWRALVAFRFARMVAAPVLVGSGIVAAIWYAPELGTFRIPVWFWISGAVALAAVLVFRFSSIRIWLIEMRYRIFL